MQVQQNGKMKELVYPPPNIVRTQNYALLVNLFVILRRSDSSFEEKMVNYWAESANYFLETEKMLYCTL